MKSRKLGKLNLMPGTATVRDVIRDIDKKLNTQLVKPSICPKCHGTNTPLAHPYHHTICLDWWHNYNLNPPDFKPTFKGL